MNQYDPLKAPDPAQWLGMAESERIALVEQYHRRAEIRLPNQTVHAAIHAVVETQIAEDHELPARETLERLMQEGLDRHDALHAIGIILAEHMHTLMTGSNTSADPNAEYCRGLKTLTAAKWRKDHS